jgi:hypothetical protein
MEMGRWPRRNALQDQPKFIKFALGENVKQANWECKPYSFLRKNGRGTSLTSIIFNVPKNMMCMENIYNSSSKRDKTKAPELT